MSEPIELETPLAGPVTSLARPAVVVDPADPIRLVAERMNEAGATSAVVSGKVIGIVTDSDLRSRVVAAGVSGDDPVGPVATSPVVTVAGSETLGDALAMMLERNIQHMPVVENGRVVGMLDARRLLAVADPSPLRLGSQVAHAGSVDALSDLVARLPVSAERFLASGMRALSVHRMLSVFGDELTRKVVDLAGPPPGSFAWLALGSQARFEQGLHTDQDHALVVEPGGDLAEWRAWAGTVVDGLAGAGVARCHGGTMASEEAWCHDPDGWRRWVATRMSNTEPRAVLEAASAMDARVVTGHPGLASPLRDLHRQAVASAPFMARLAAVASHFRVPVGFFGRVADRFDIKESAIGPITVIARVYGLVAGSEAHDTPGRLSDAESAGELSSDLAELLRQGFEVTTRIRLEHHLDTWRAGEPYDNMIDLDRLTSWEETLLRQVFKAVREAQTALENRFQTGYVR